MSVIFGSLLAIVSFVFLISIVVVIHELGHYWAGRWCGVHAEAFSMGFGPTMFSWRDKNGTVWRIAALPIGGYVKFLGDAGAASEPDSEKLKELRERMGNASEKCYHFKPIWQRAFITAAGPIANFMLAIFIFAVMALSFGDRFNEPVVGSISTGTPAETAGFEIYDRIVSINGMRIRDFSDIAREAVWRPGEELNFQVQRGDEIITIRAAAELVTVQDRFGGERQFAQVGLGSSSIPMIGRIEPGGAAEMAGFMSRDVVLSVDGQPVRVFQDIERAVEARSGETLTYVVRRGEDELSLRAALPFRDRETLMQGQGQGMIGSITMASAGAMETYQSYNPVTALIRGADRTWGVVYMTARYVSYVVTLRSPPTMLNGPLGIAETAGQMAQTSIEQGRSAAESAFLWLVNMILLAAFLSVGLGLVNLLPIPILDGGHLVYYAYEAVARRPLSMKAQQLGFQLGLALVLGMMLLATWNDINYKLSQWF
ncbi:RIP metalloprotease RseP [Maricaulis sp.]|uniref:RIP metalloprotease RseP n=1 Tax=Maricaulis sp. TaxID=1486257 RepID=UPI002634DABE|nr:RIP metalloprotease RseP [Maricaulis sp.]